MKHTLPNLAYPNNALEPVISHTTIEFHYGKHLQAYIDNLNRLTEGTEYENMSLEDIVCKAPEGSIYNNAGQVLNHTLYFNQFAPAETSRKAPTGKLATAIEKTFGNFVSFQKEFVQAGVSLFGSGWVWLAADQTGNLSIRKEVNAGIPLRNGLHPLLCFDVWEHAYYLDYQNKRQAHLEALWSLIDWAEIERRYPF